MVLYHHTLNVFLPAIIEAEHSDGTYSVTFFHRGSTSYSYTAEGTDVGQIKRKQTV